MNACEELAPLIAARPLGVLEPEDEARVAEHLAVCAGCPAVAKGFDEALATAVPAPRKAPGAAWDKLRARIERDQAAPAKGDELRVVLDCSFCHAGLAKREAVYCASCLAPHHQDCFSEHGRCSAPGCGETQTVKPRSLEPAEPVRPAARRNFGAVVGVFLVGMAGLAGFTIELGMRGQSTAVPTPVPTLPPPTTPLPSPPAAPSPPAVPSSSAVVFVAGAPIEAGFAYYDSRQSVIAVGRDGSLYEIGTDGARRFWPGAQRDVVVFRQRVVSEGVVGEFGDVFSAAAIQGSRAYIGTTGGVLGLDLRDRGQLMAYRVPRGAVVGRPLLVKEVNQIVCGTTDSEVLAFAPNRPDPLWTYATDAPVRQPGVVLEGAEHAAFVSEDGLLHVISLRDGQRSFVPVEVGRPIAPPVASAGGILVANDAGELVRLQLSLPTHEWQRTRWRDPRGRPSSFVVVSERQTVVVANDDGEVRLLDAKTLVVHSEHRGCRGPRTAPPQGVLLRGRVHEGEDQALFLWGDGRAYVIAPSAGNTGREVALAPGKLSVTPTRVLVSDQNGQVHFFDRP